MAGASHSSSRARPALLLLLTLHSCLAGTAAAAAATLCSEGCPAAVHPVCGTDGRSYSNGCVAGCAGAAVATQGYCPGDKLRFKQAVRSSAFSGLLWGLAKESGQEPIPAAVLTRFAAEGYVYRGKVDMAALSQRTGYERKSPAHSKHAPKEQGPAASRSAQDSSAEGLAAAAAAAAATPENTPGSVAVSNRQSSVEVAAAHTSASLTLASLRGLDALQATDSSAGLEAGQALDEADATDVSDSSDGMESGSSRTPGAAAAAAAAAAGSSGGQKQPKPTAAQAKAADSTGAQDVVVIRVDSAGNMYTRTYTYDPQRFKQWAYPPFDPSGNTPVEAKYAQQQKQKQQQAPAAAGKPDAAGTKAAATPAQGSSSGKPAAAPAAAPAASTPVGRSAANAAARLPSNGTLPVAKQQGGQQGKQGGQQQQQPAASGDTAAVAAGSQPGLKAGALDKATPGSGQQQQQQPQKAAASSPTPVLSESQQQLLQQQLQAPLKEQQQLQVAESALLKEPKQLLAASQQQLMPGQLQPEYGAAQLATPAGSSGVASSSSGIGSGSSAAGSSVSSSSSGAVGPSDLMPGQAAAADPRVIQQLSPAQQLLGAVGARQIPGAGGGGSSSGKSAAKGDKAGVKPPEAQQQEQPSGAAKGAAADTPASSSTSAPGDGSAAVAVPPAAAGSAQEGNGSSAAPSPTPGTAAAGKDGPADAATGSKAAAPAPTASNTTQAGSSQGNATSTPAAAGAEDGSSSGDNGSSADPAPPAAAAEPAAPAPKTSSSSSAPGGAVKKTGLFGRPLPPCDASGSYCRDKILATSTMFGTQPSSGKFMDQSWLVGKARISSVQMFYNSSSGCLRGLRVTYKHTPAAGSSGSDGSSSTGGSSSSGSSGTTPVVQLLGSAYKHPTVVVKELKLKGDEIIGKAQIWDPKCIKFLRLFTNKGQKVSVGSIDMGSEGQARNVTKNRPNGLLLAIKGWQDPPKKHAATAKKPAGSSPGVLKQLQFVWGATYCDNQCIPAPAPFGSSSSSDSSSSVVKPGALPKANDLAAVPPGAETEGYHRLLLSSKQQQQQQQEQQWLPGVTQQQLQLLRQQRQHELLSAAAAAEAQAPAVGDISLESGENWERAASQAAAGGSSRSSGSSSGSNGSSSGGSSVAAASIHRMLSVINKPDDRIPCPAKTFPFYAMGQIKAKASDGGFVCSGGLISSNRVLTAGHCVWDDRNTQGPFKDLRFAPGQWKVGSKVESPFGFVDWDYVTLFDTYVNDPDGEGLPFDVAVITLSKPVGTELGWLGMRAETPPCRAAPLTLSLAGYPADDPEHPRPGGWAGGCFYDSCDVMFSCSVRITNHTCDSYVGQSGAPMFDGENYVRAVHTLGVLPGFSTTNGAITIQKFMLDNIMGYWRETEGFAAPKGAASQQSKAAEATRRGR